LAIGYRASRERGSGAPSMRLAMGLSCFCRLASFPIAGGNGLPPLAAPLLGEAALQHGHEIDDVVGRRDLPTAALDRPAVLLGATSSCSAS
jgi:hypothetical protein